MIIQILLKSKIYCTLIWRRDPVISSNNKTCIWEGSNLHQRKQIIYYSTKVLKSLYLSSTIYRIETHYETKQTSNKFISKNRNQIQQWIKNNTNPMNIIQPKINSCRWSNNLYILKVLIVLLLCYFLLHRYSKLLIVMHTNVLQICPKLPYH